MAVTNHERIGKMLDLLRDGLVPFAERELKSQFEQTWFEQLKSSLPPQQLGFSGTEANPQWDIAVVLAVIWNQWNTVFRKTLGQAERTLISELREARNRWAHQRPFSTDDAYRALDSASRLLAAISAPQAGEVEKMKMELLRLRFDEQARSERRKATGTNIESQVNGHVKPWREIVTPHKDVASGRYQQAEFAADLWQVYLGEGVDEYRNPVEFFRRTHLTASLQRLLIGAAQKMTGQGGDPVVQLQTNFGGGKTHSMLALFHLFSGKPASELSGVESVLAQAGVEKLPKVNRVVLVGNKISPGNPVTKSDGTIIRTLWGELAWQLGLSAGGAKEAKKAFGRVKADDEKATNPGDVLRELMNEYGPCLVLVDEWVAYARQLHEKRDLPGGDFETHFTFAQTLTESAKDARQCMLVISLPASDTTGSPHAVADDAEVGGERGRAALERLRNAVGRVETSWRPASAEESFEIVRRRLFEPMVEKSNFVARDNTARAFYDLYRTQHQEFPPECRDTDYEKRLKDAYPIHPEIFDRLYTDWSTLLKFQRTRGVLRLMAAVIHSLWDNADRNPLILPCNIPIDDSRVQSELTRYLSDNWAPVIEKDVDGPNSLPRRIDNEVPNLGKFSACRRVARTIYLGSAPTATAANRGLEERRIKLGCVMPGESVAIFGDALRRLSGAATYLYYDAARYWYSTQPTVTKIAEDRAEQLKADPDAVVQELERRLRADVRDRGDFNAVHALPQSGQDIPDELDARLVVLRIEYPHTKDAESPARAAATAFLETRGTSPRLYRNTLVFLAVDRSHLQDLDEAVRRYLAWVSVLDESDVLDLSKHQIKQAEQQKENANALVKSRIPETYQWLLVPVQPSPQQAMGWQVFRLAGDEALAVRAAKKLRKEEMLVTSFAGTSLKDELDRIPLWRGDHVSIRQVAEDFARYVYLPRLARPQVLLNAIVDGLGLLTWERESFAFADSYDEATARYRGLRYGKAVMLADASAGLLVRPEAARRQIDADAAAQGVDAAVGQSSSQTSSGSSDATTGQPVTRPAEQPTRFHGTVNLDPTRVGRDAGRISDEVISHLAGLVGAKVKVTLEIDAEVPNGAPDNVVRTVTENSRTLKFTNQGFEKE
jgi:predicted AAA+ superfamily ATPase